RVDIYGLNLGLDALEAPDPVGLVLGGETEGHAHPESKVPFRPEIHGEEEARYEFRLAGVAATAGQRQIAERGGHAAVVLEFGFRHDVGAAEREVLARRKPRHARGIPPYGGRVFRDRRGAGIGISEAADALLVKRESGCSRLVREAHQKTG